MIKNKDVSTSQATELRRQAEQRLQEHKTEQPLPGAEHDARRLLHELQVHQIELEMQNEELMSARVEIEAGLERYTDLYDFAPVGYFSLDHDGTICQVNITGASLLGVERAKLVHCRLGCFVAPAELGRWNQYLGSLLQSADKQTCELAFTRTDGSTFHVRLESTRLDRPAQETTGGDSALAIRMAMIDISDRKRAEDALQEAHEKLLTVLESITDGFFSLDREFRLTYVNHEAEKVLQKTRKEMLGKNLWELFPAMVGSEFQRKYELAMSENRTMSFEEFYPPTDQWYAVHAYPSPAGLSVYFTNSTHRKQAELTMQHESDETKKLVLTDSLTGIGSRKALEDSMNVELARAARYSRPCSLAMLDIDQFKSINDILGHQAGDHVLTELGHCLKSEKRPSDILARYGGDEFVIIMPETSQKDGLRMMERIRLKIKSLNMAKDHPVTISCGIAEFAPYSGLTPEELLRRADMAMYRGKKLGRDRIETWESVSAHGMSKIAAEEVPQVKALQKNIAAVSTSVKEFFVQSIRSLSQALAARDPYTKSHSDNVLRYSVAIAKTMELLEMEMETIQVAALLHDIGKLGVPDSILLKTGKLTTVERQVMEEHPLTAVRILDSMRFFDHELPAIRHHHERWDGNGYPDHLAGQRIPLDARILTVADAFDAMTSTRVYQPSRTVAQALDVIQECENSQFDPNVTAAFRRWVNHTGRRLKKSGTLTTHDLLVPQHNSISPVSKELARVIIGDILP